MLAAIHHDRQRSADTWAWVLVTGLFLSGFCGLSSAGWAADMTRQYAETDDDDDDETLATGSTTPRSLIAPSQSKELPRAVFNTFSARDWFVEVGVQQRLTSRLGRRRVLDGATGLLLDIVWSDTLFISSERGIGANLMTINQLFSPSGRFQAGASFSYDDRDSGERSRSQGRAGDAKIRVSPLVLGFAEYQHDRWRLWTEIAHFTGNAKGNVASLGLEYWLPLTAKWSTTLAVGASVADKTYVKDNYPATLLAIPGRPLTPFRPSSTARDLTVSADFEYRADQHWRWNAIVGFTNSLALAKPGTVIKTRSAPFVSSGIRYRF
jgi:outer membrane scaffolding protein for murein synthesis (MipA/OmpV family)